MYTTGGTVTDNLNIGPADLTLYFLTAPSDSRLPGGGNYQVGPLYNLTPEGFARPQDLLIKSTKDVGDDTRVFNGVDVTFNVRNVRGFTFSGGTSTGKVVNDWCAVRAAVPEHTVFGASWTLNPFCHVESPFQTAFNGLASYISRKSTCMLSTVIQDKPNIGTDQIDSLDATYTLSPADHRRRSSADWPSADVGRLRSRSTCSRQAICTADRIRQWDFVGEEDLPLRRPSG